jgi:hypothetical protein
MNGYYTVDPFQKRDASLWMMALTSPCAIQTYGSSEEIVGRFGLGQLSK